MRGDRAGEMRGMATVIGAALVLVLAFRAGRVGRRLIGGRRTGDHLLSPVPSLPRPRPGRRSWPAS